MFRLNFTTKVLGEKAAGRLRDEKVGQTLRSPNSGVARALLDGTLKIGDLMEVALDGGELIGLAYPAIADRVSWVILTPSDAVRGGFDTLDDLKEALQRGGYRFQPMEKYQLYRIQFTWKK